MADATFINAEYLKLTLVARRVTRFRPAPCRWCVMGTRIMGATDCRAWWAAESRRAGNVNTFRAPSIMQPLCRGDILTAIERMRVVQGLPALKKAFGISIRALRAELSSSVMR